MVRLGATPHHRSRHHRAAALNSGTTPWMLTPHGATAMRFSSRANISPDAILARARCRRRADRSCVFVFSSCFPMSFPLLPSPAFRADTMSLACLIRRPRNPRWHPAATPRRNHRIVLLFRPISVGVIVFIVRPFVERRWRDGKPATKRVKLLGAGHRGHIAVDRRGQSSARYVRLSRTGSAAGSTLAAPLNTGGTFFFSA